MRPVSGLVLATLFLFSCRSAPPPFLELSLGDPQVRQAVGALGELDAARQSLRAEARVTLEGTRGSSFARQLLLLERPGSLRLEVMGLLGQRIAVLASDGESYDLYRAETGRVETAQVHPALLLEVAGVPLPVEDLVQILMGVPPRPLDRLARAKRNEAGDLHLDFSLADGGQQRLSTDPTGRLQALLLRDAEGREQVEVQYLDPSPSEGFAQQVQLIFAAAGLAAEVTFQRWELGPTLDPGLFRLQLVSSTGG